ncbi:MAG: hypothetical protein ACKPGN_27155 [Dolichospermum sp.]
MNDYPPIILNDRCFGKWEGDSASAAASSSLFGDVGGRSLAKIEVT